MQKIKRLVIATLGGVGCGFICLGLTSSGEHSLDWPIVAQILCSRTLIGVAIGISCLSLGHWIIHGLVMGLIFSLSFAFGSLMAPDIPNFSKEMMFISTLFIGMIYGLLIEFVTSILFKARMKK